MAFTGSTLCDSFLREILEGVHNFKAAGGNSFKLALYTSSATLTAATTAYTATNEYVGAGYSAGGVALTNVGASVIAASGSVPRTVVVDFGDAVWLAGLTNVRGALLYNDTAAGDPAVAVIDFGANKTSSTSFTVQFPTGDALNAVIRIAG
jgi:hypothetical protein